MALRVLPLDIDTSGSTAVEYQDAAPEQLEWDDPDTVSLSTLHWLKLFDWQVPENTGPSETAGSAALFDSTQYDSHEFDALVIAAEQSNEAMFVQAAANIDWSQRTAAEFTDAIGLALAAGAHPSARDLAILGARYHPHDPELQKAARILAPPRVLRTNLPPTPSLQANREWLQANRATYRGQWVALREGRLLASATSPRDLRSQLGSLDGLFIARVT